MTMPERMLEVMRDEAVPVKIRDGIARLIVSRMSDFAILENKRT
jgi:hypothetical protein